MLSTIFSVTFIEKLLTLVEISAGDKLHHSITSSDPQYGFLLWYYQFVRAESYISIGISFLIMTCIVISWWYSSYQHEEETFEIFTVVFPNDSIEWWYDWMIENMLLAAYFLYVCFIELYYYWTPVYPEMFPTNLRFVTIRRYMLAERTKNIFKILFSSQKYYRIAGFPLEKTDLDSWIQEELFSAENIREVGRDLTFDGWGWRARVYYRPTFEDRLRFFWYVRISQILSKRLHHLPRYMDVLRATYPLKKISKYISFVNLQEWATRASVWAFVLVKRGNNYEYYTKKKARKEYKAFIKSTKYVLYFLHYFNRYIGNIKTFTIWLEDHDDTETNRGSEFVRYHYYMRKYRNLVPFQKYLHRWIYAGRRRVLDDVSQECYDEIYRNPGLSDPDVILQTFQSTERPMWHDWFFEYHWVDGEEGSRGFDYGSYIGNHWRLWPTLFFYAASNGLCWEEDELDMYEDEFDDWDLSLDPNSGELNTRGMDLEYDEDLDTLESEETDEKRDRDLAADQQRIKDEAKLEADQDKVFTEEFNEDDEFDEDIDAFGVDHYGRIFEYYADPVAAALEYLQLHPEYGLDMPPPWGRLEEASTVYRTFLDRMDGLIQGYYHYNHVFTEDGVSSPFMWWDGGVKSWRFDGQPMVYLIMVGGKLRKILNWYYLEYRELKRENEPPVFQKMLEVDKETRKKRPHYHGMAFWRGELTPKEDAGIFFNRVFKSLTDEQRKIIAEYSKEVTERERLGEEVDEDDYERRYGKGKPPTQKPPEAE